MTLLLACLVSLALVAGGFTVGWFGRGAYERRRVMKRFDSLQAVLSSMSKLAGPYRYEELVAEAGRLGKRATTFEQAVRDFAEHRAKRQAVER